MDESQTYSLVSLLQHELLCCRVCLMMDCKLYNIHEYKLADTFTRISGTPVSRDRLPQYLCAYCLALLLKCSSFREMCLRTLELLTPALLKGALDTDYVRKYQNPQRSLLTQTELEIIELNPSQCLFNEQILNEHILNNLIIPAHIINEASHQIPHIQEDIFETSINNDSEQLILEDESISQREHEIPIFKNILLTGKVIKRKTKTKTPIKTKNNLKTIRKVTTKRQTKSKTKVKVNKDMDIGKNIMETEIENNEKNYMTIEHDKIKQSKVTDESKDSDRNNDISKIVEGPVEPKKRRRRKRERPLPEANLAEFGIRVNHEIITLSKEEQLEEIATRKKSKIYLESPFKCEDCGKGYGVEAPYNNHRDSHRPSRGPHWCDVCGVRFRFRYTLRRHQVRHRLKLICNQCSFVSRDKSQATNHHGTHVGKTYNCPHCEKSFIKSTTYFTHVRLVHPELNVDCLDCGETFVSNTGLLQHRHRVHTMKLHQFVCTTCPAKFNSEEALRKHSDSTGEHDETGLRPCEQCGENCASDEALQEHVGVVHPTGMYPCERCVIKFSNAAALETHKRRKHEGQRLQAPRRKHRVRGRRRHPRRVMCDQCGISVQNSSLLEYHKRIHLEVKPFACPHCPKTFALPFTLKDHIRSHTGERPYQCPECPLAFAIKGNFKRHYKVTHRGIRGVFPCPVCARASTTKASMQLHVRAVHGDAGWPKRDRSKRKTNKKIDNK